MRRMLLFFVAAFATLAIAVPAALADSPHFLSSSFAINSSTGNLECSFKEAGLGTTATSADISCTAATSSAVYQCFNNGGQHPKAGNKETVGGLVTNTQTFPIRNGQTTGTVIVGPFSPGSFSCPSGQSLYLQSVCYDDITISGEGASTPTAYTGGDELCNSNLHLLVTPRG
jgi:hypothetical protein